MCPTATSAPIARSSPLPIPTAWPAEHRLFVLSTPDDGFDQVAAIRPVDEAGNSIGGLLPQLGTKQAVDYVPTVTATAARVYFSNWGGEIVSWSPSQQDHTVRLLPATDSTHVIGFTVSSDDSEIFYSILRFAPPPTPALNHPPRFLGEELHRVKAGAGGPDQRLPDPPIDGMYWPVGTVGGSLLLALGGDPTGIGVDASPWNALRGLAVIDPATNQIQTTLCPGVPVAGLPTAEGVLCMPDIPGGNWYRNDWNGVTEIIGPAPGGHTCRLRPGSLAMGCGGVLVSPEGMQSLPKANVRAWIDATHYVADDDSSGRITIVPTDSSGPIYPWLYSGTVAALFPPLQ